MPFFHQNSPLIGSKYRLEEAYKPLLVTYHLIDNFRRICTDVHDRITHVKCGHDDPHKYHQNDHQ